MAQEEVILKLSAEVGDLRKELETVRKGIEGVGDSAKKTEANTGKLAKGIKGIGLSFKNVLKASGVIFVLQKAFESLSEVFKQNQKSVDLFNTAFEFVSIAMNDFVNFLFGNVGNVVQVFKDFFENPKDKAIEFAKTIKEGVIARFNELLEVFSLVGKAVGHLFAGEFKLAADTAKQAGKEVVDVFTGVDESFEKVAEKVKNYAVQTFNSAKANVELSKSAEIAAVQVQGLIEKYDRQAESLRQVRDDTSRTFEERIQANKDLGVVLEEQMTQMLALRQIELNAAQADLDKLDNQENLIKVLEAKNELAAVEAQITGFRSEQLTNQVALEQELLDARNQIFLEGLSQREREIEETALHYDEQIKLAKKAGIDTIDLEKNKAKAISDIKKAALMNDLNAVAGMLSSASALQKEGSDGWKATKIAETIISTYTGAQQAFTSMSGIPVVGPALGTVAAGLAIASGLQNIATIRATPIPEGKAQGGMISGFGSGTSDSVPARLSRGESVINAKSTRMFKPLLSAINQAGGGVGFADGGTLDSGTAGQTTGVVKAFVVADDMTNQQERVAKIRRKATI